MAGSGTRRVTALETAKAAWIISKYGSYRYPIQNAAVETALDDLLVGGRWALNGGATRQRLRQSGQEARIHQFAATMLSGANRYAGPYRITVTVAPHLADLTSLPVTVKVTSVRTGRGIQDLPVLLTYPTASSVTVRTGADGTAQTSVTPTAPVPPGPHLLTAHVSRLPETRLLVSTSRTTGASRVLIAGRKTVRSVLVVTAVQAHPQVTSVSTSPTITTSQPAPALFTVTGGYPSRRTAIATLYGPFSSTDAARCTPATSAATTSFTVTAAGRYAAGAVRVASPGYYLWGATLSADAYNTAASFCAGSVAVLSGSSAPPQTGSSESAVGTDSLVPSTVAESGHAH
jgi:hypothetical protein